MEVKMMETKRSRNLNIFFSFFSIVISFIIVLIANCLSIEDGKFSFDAIGAKLQDPLFWIITLACSLSLILAYFAFYNLKRTKNLMSDDFSNKIKVYNERLKLKPVDFPIYIRENNLEEKIRVYKENTLDIIGKYENKYMKIPNEKLNSEKAIKLKEKIDSLKERLEEDFINKNIMHMKVKYTELHARNFRKDSFGTIVDDRKDFSNEKFILSKTGAAKVIINVLTTLATNTLILSCALYLSFSPQFFLVILSTLFSMSMNAFFGTLQADRVYREEILIPIENKTIILEQSIAWANKTPNKTFREVIQDFIDEKSKLNETKTEGEK